MNATRTTQEFPRAYTVGYHSNSVFYGINGKDSNIGSLSIHRDTFAASLTETPTLGLQKDPAKFIPLVAAAYALAALDIAEVQAQRELEAALKVANDLKIKEEAEKAALFTTVSFRSIDNAASFTYMAEGLGGPAVRILIPAMMSPHGRFYQADEVGQLIDHLAKIKAVLESRG